jgi:hypothetical protein
MPAATGRPIEDVKAFLEVNGQDPEFGGYSRDMWIAAAITSGVVFDARHFEVAWEVAKEAGFVAPLKGAPKKGLQAKRRTEAKAVPTCTDASSFDAAGERKKAGGA